MPAREARKGETPRWRSTTALPSSPGKTSGAQWAHSQSWVPAWHPQGGFPSADQTGKPPNPHFSHPPQGQTFLRAASHQPSPTSACGRGAGQGGAQGLRLGGHGETGAGAQWTQCRVSPWEERERSVSVCLCPGCGASGTQQQAAASSSHTTPQYQPTSPVPNLHVHLYWHPDSMPNHYRTANPLFTSTTLCTSSLAHLHQPGTVQ